MQKHFFLSYEASSDRSYVFVETSCRMLLFLRRILLSGRDSDNVGLIIVIRGSAS